MAPIMADEHNTTGALHCFHDQWDMAQTQLTINEDANNRAK